MARRRTKKPKARRLSAAALRARDSARARDLARARAQSLARRRVASYIDRLSKTKAASRLDISVKELEHYLRSRKFPKTLLLEAQGLGVPGTGFTKLPRTRLAVVLKKLGPRKTSKLTGLTPARLAEIVRRNPQARVKISRATAKAQIKKIGAEALGNQLSATPRSLESAATPKLTRSTRRLQLFVEKYGSDDPDLIANFLGLHPRELTRWLSRGVPPKDERDLLAKIGRSEAAETDQATKLDRLRRGRKRNIDRLIAEALRKTAAWNKKTPTRFHISKAVTKRLARLGTFEKHLDEVKVEFVKSKAKPTKPVRPPRRPRPAPRPVKPPPPPYPTIIEPPAPPPAIPPKTTAPPITESVVDLLREFLAKRTEAIADGKFSSFLPVVAFDKFDLWRGQNREGLRLYRKVGKFVFLLDLTIMGNKMIADARKIWNMLKRPGEFMTVKLVFSAQGLGNPFYPGAWEPDKNEFGFFNRNTDIIGEAPQIEFQIRSVLDDVFNVSEDVQLFFEHYEIVKSAPKKK